MKKFLIITGILFVMFITIASVKSHKTITDPAKHVPEIENVTREYVAAVVDEVHIELFGLREGRIDVEEWMTKPFADSIEEPLEVEEWMTSPFVIN